VGARQVQCSVIFYTSVLFIIELRSQYAGHESKDSLIPDLGAIPRSRSGVLGIWARHWIRL